MNSENSKTSEPYVLILNLTDKLDLRRGERSIVLSNLSIYCTWKNIEKSYKSNKLKISVPTWNKELELSDGSYSISDIQDYFKYIFKKHGEKTINLPIGIYTNKIENRIKFKVKLKLKLVIILNFYLLKQ